jgi:hypothetical protein
MSRTIRRKNYVPIWVTHSWERLGNGSNGWGRVPKEGKELAQALHKHHGDTARWTWPSKWIRQQCQIKHRAEANVELNRYKKNEEYEVIIPRKELLPWD